MPHDPELESHLASRLAETRDVAAFSRTPPPAGSEEVERVVALPEHLGGRRIADKFSRSKPPKPEPAREKGLEHHLKSRLGEIQDQGLAPRSEAAQAVEAYRELRRRMES